MNKFSFRQNTTAKPTAVENERLEVLIQPQELLADYAKNFVSEGFRKHPLLAQQVNISAEEVFNYAKYLLNTRIQHVNGDRRQFRDHQLLFVPAWIEYTISNIGVLVIRELGLTFVPVMDEPVISYEEARDISRKVQMFEGTLQVVTNAFPNDTNGDQDLMTTAIIANYVRSSKELVHPVTTYLTAFLGLKLREENAFSVLYRVQYDDISYLRQALDSEGSVIC